jgi:glucose/arabinose dehydrogenase
MIEMVMFPGSNDEALVANQSGLIWRVSISQNHRELIGDLRAKVGTQGFEEGLLSVTFSPNFAQDRLVYAYYTRGSPQPSVLSSFRIPGNHIDPASERVILEVPQPQANHNGGRVLFGPDGYLYLSLGDGGGAGDPGGHGQNTGTLLGSIIRIAVTEGGYAVPADNPFVGQAGRDEIYAYGLRNPWRFSFDRATGALWLGDVGQNRWEEINRIQRGGNYGWNVMEGYECYSPPTGCNQAGLQMPRAVYPIAGRPECAITGGYVYRGPALPELNGWYIYGDYCSGKIWALNTADVSEPVLLVDTGLSITSFAELPGGEIAVITFNNAIYRLMR